MQARTQINIKHKLVEKITHLEFQHYLNIIPYAQPNIKSMQKFLPMRIDVCTHTLV